MQKDIVSASRDKAQQAFKDLEDAVVMLLGASANGMRNIDVADALGLRSARDEKQKNYLTWKVLTGLVRQGRVTKQPGRNPLYRVADKPTARPE